MFSASDQVLYRKFPYIIGNIFSAALPEQAAFWSYPVVDGKYEPRDGRPSDDEVAVNMVNGIMGRMHLASDLGKLTPQQTELVRLGVAKAKQLAAFRRTAVPWLPFGFARFGDKKALDYLYNLSISNYYFQKTKVDKNIVWNTDYPSKNIEVSINLSKPEKNNKDIAKLLVKPDPSQIKYPKCLLCLENLGFAGNLNHPARENIRIIPLKLSGEEWYLQYSPYGYFYKQ